MAPSGVVEVVHQGTGTALLCMPNRSIHLAGTGQTSATRHTGIVCWNMASNDTTTDFVKHCQLYRFVISAVIIGLLCILGLIGNILAFITFGTLRQHNASTVLFRSLAVADSLMLLFAMLLFVPQASAVYMDLETAKFDAIFMYFTLYAHPAALIAQSTTVWISLLLAANRYIAVCKPLMASRLCTVSNARRQLCLVVLLCLAIMSPRFFETYIIYVKIEDTNEMSAEYFTRSWAATHWYVKLSWAIYTFVVFVIPFICILILGIRIVFVIRSATTKQIRRHSKRDSSDNLVTRLVFVILLVFLLCQTPALVNQFLWIILPHEVRTCGRFQFYFRRIANVFATLNSAVNFIIYISFNEKFRKTLCNRFRNVELSTLESKRGNTAV